MYSEEKCKNEIKEKILKERFVMKKGITLAATAVMAAAMLASCGKSDKSEITVISREDG